MENKDTEVFDVAAFGKVVFISKNHTIPALPDMNLIILKNSGAYQAICIDIEIDTIGDTVKEACDNLKHALYAYTAHMVDNYDGDVKAAVEDIVNTAFSQGDLKTRLFGEYLKAKHQHLIEKISREHRVKSRIEVFFNALHAAFQLEPIRFNLTLAAGVA